MHVTNARLHTDVRVGIGQQRLDADQNLGDRQRQTPVMVDRVEADVPVARNVRVEYLGDEANNRRSHRVAAITSNMRVLKIQYIPKPNE